MKLRDRKAFITGASRGIGRAVALAYATEGAVVALGARSMEPLEKLAAEIDGAGGRAVPIAIDVGSSESIEKAHAEVAAKLGDIQILVNNAGIAKSVKVLNMDDEHWQSHLDINLVSSFGTAIIARVFFSELTVATVTRREVGQRITEFTLVVDPERCHFLLDIRPGVCYGSCGK